MYNYSRNEIIEDWQDAELSDVEARQLLVDMNIYGEFDNDVYRGYDYTNQTRITFNKAV